MGSFQNCISEHIKRFGQTGNHIQRYRCLDCKKTFTPVTGTIFEGHKISIREWMDYTLNIFRYVSINADSWNNRNAFTTSRYWLEKIFLVLRAYYAEIEPFSGRVYLDETYYSVRSDDIKRTPEGARLRGISTNQLCIGVACTDDRILCVFEGNGRPSKRKTFKSLTLMHGFMRSRRERLRKTGMKTIRRCHLTLSLHSMLIADCAKKETMQPVRKNWRLLSTGFIID